VSETGGDSIFVLRVLGIHGDWLKQRAKVTIAKIIYSIYLSPFFDSSAHFCSQIIMCKAELLLLTQYVSFERGGAKWDIH